MTEHQAHDGAFRRQMLLQAISGLGPVVQLGFHIDSQRFQQDIAPFADRWTRYNPRKDIERYGLSLTSLDGNLTGVPDLDSLVEYNRLNGTRFDEPDFRKPTPVFNAMTALAPILEKFSAELGRSHLIRFGRGGHFPPHRDAFGLGVSCFRILGLCQNCGRDQFVFMLGGERVHLEQGKVYFIDTRIDHSVFSFSDDCVIMVLNVLLNDVSYRSTMESVHIR